MEQHIADIQPSDLSESHGLMYWCNDRLHYVFDDQFIQALGKCVRCANHGEPHEGNKPT